MQTVLRVVNNRVFQIIVSVIALYYFYTTTDVVKILSKIGQVPLAFLIFILIYNLLVASLASVRWGIILLGKPKIKQIWQLYKSSQSSGFFAMFLPTPLAGDGLKWARVTNIFPSLAKSHILASILVDRVIGMSTLVITGFVAVLLSAVAKYPVTNLVYIVATVMFCAVVLFYTILLFFDFDKLEGKNKFLDKFIQIDKAFRQERSSSIILAITVSVIAQFVWMLPILFTGRMFGVNLHILDVFVYVPIMSLILALPISFNGFGPREALYVYFFSPLGHSPEALLAMSAFMGVSGLVGGLVSGIFVLL